MTTDLTVSLDCRDMRHGWQRAGDTVLIKQAGQVRHFERKLECFRCGCMRVDEYKITRVALERIRSRYVYPEGYRVPGGLSVADARFKLFSQMDMGLRDVV